MEHSRGRNSLLVFFLLVAATVTGCATTTNSPSEPTSPSKTAVQQMRFINQSKFDLKDVVVIFPEERVQFGDVPAGVTTAYQDFNKGVYRDAAYRVEIDGQVYEQPVVDWVGEKPMEGEAFTYLLNVDPTKWKTEGWVIQLAEVTIDSPE